MYKFIYCSSLFVLFTLSACQKDFLDQVPDDRLTIEQVFQRRDLSEQYLANIYDHIHDGTYVTNSAPWIGLSDEGDVTYDRPGYLTFLMNVGNWNPASGYYDDHFYGHYYRGIRSATYFMEHIGGNQQLLDESGGEDVIRQWTAEARFLRAYFYFCLLKIYGPAIIVGDDLIPGDLQPDDPQLNLPRSSYDECVDYIVSELDLAAQSLPLHFTEQSDLDYGRATKALCMAVKSRLLLYAASPLYNGNQDYSDFKNPDGKQLINQQYSAVKWEKAAEAAKAVIDLGIFDLYKKGNEAGEFDPLISYRDVFLDPWNEEIIFARIENNLSGWERALTPRLANGYCSTGPPQKMVDSYHMVNGLVPIMGYQADGSPIINPESGYVEEGFSIADGKYTLEGTYNMWVNREPRFYASVNYNGAPWINTSEGIKRIETFYSGESGKRGSWDYPRSGYFIRKNVHPNSNPRTSQYVKRPYVMFRYAEILLNYVEALNEYDPGNSDILLYLNMIRERAGIPQFGTGTSALPVPSGQDEMREKIWRERKIELAFEHLRYFDTRRWKVAEETDGGPFYGMNVDADPPAFYKRTVFETRVFRKNYYLFPIPQSQMDRNTNMVQNPGW